MVVEGKEKEEQIMFSPKTGKKKKKKKKKRKVELTDAQLEYRRDKEYWKYLRIQL